MTLYVRDVGVAGSNPVTPNIYFRSIPGRWVTDYSGHIGKRRRWHILTLGAITETQYQETFDTNVKGVIFTVQKAIPLP
jgi:NAD(P)-dependent dehydrogenase (short-subunit alcohol dehydrogenase family)